MKLQRHVTSNDSKTHEKALRINKPALLATKGLLRHQKLARLGIHIIIRVGLYAEVRGDVTLTIRRALASSITASRQLGRDAWQRFDQSKNSTSINAEIALVRLRQRSRPRWRDAVAADNAWISGMRTFSVSRYHFLPISDHGAVRFVVTFRQRGREHRNRDHSGCPYLCAANQENNKNPSLCLRSFISASFFRIRRYFKIRI
jgi:hypothetical protein